MLVGSRSRSMTTLPVSTSASGEEAQHPGGTISSQTLTPRLPRI